MILDFLASTGVGRRMLRKGAGHRSGSSGAGRGRRGEGTEERLLFLPTPSFLASGKGRLPLFLPFEKTRCLVYTISTH